MRMLFRVWQKLVADRPLRVPQSKSETNHQGGL
jgi:hypothetical protein